MYTHILSHFTIVYGVVYYHPTCSIIIVSFQYVLLPKGYLYEKISSYSHGPMRSTLCSQ